MRIKYCWYLLHFMFPDFQLRGDEEALKQQLESIESERSQLQEQIQTEKEETKRLDGEEERYLKHFTIS